VIEVQSRVRQSAPGGGRVGRAGQQLGESLRPLAAQQLSLVAQRAQLQRGDRGDVLHDRKPGRMLSVTAEREQVARPSVRRGDRQHEAARHGRR
jgi:hypothetical protein